MPPRSRAPRLAGLLLAVVVAAPLATTSPATADDPYPPGERLHPGSLPIGPTTDLLRVVGTAIVDGDLRIPVAGVHVGMVGRSGADYLVLSSDESYTHWRLLRVGADGGSTRLAGGRGALPAALLADGGSHVVLTAHRRRGHLVRVLDASTGEEVRRRDFGYVEVLDFGTRRMVLSRWGDRQQRPRTFWWDPFTDRTTTIVDRTGYVADISADRLGVFTRDPYQGGCQVLTTLSVPRTRLWRSCRDAVMAFSPTAQRMVTVHLLSDGPGPLVIQVRTARGRVLDTYRAEWFGFVKWETDRRLLVQAAGTRSVAVVRCTVRHCERVSRLYRTRDHEPWTAMPPWTFAPESLLDR